MRIIHVRDVANVAQFLVRGLSELGHEVDLVSPRESAEPSVWHKMLMAPRRLLDGLRINAHIHQHNFEIVHLHYANSGWMGTLGRYPYFLHCHGSDVRHDQHHPLRKWPVLHSLGRACGVFISTPDLYPHVASFRPDAVFLPNPIDTRIFAPLSNGSHRNTRILINQAAKASKAPHVAFGAARQLKRTLKNLEICAFAYGPELERFRGYDEVQFIEPVPHSRMPETINSFDIILGQFAIGSLGVSELEGMACGKPVVSYMDQAMYSKWYGEPPPILSACKIDSVVEAVVSLVQEPDLGEKLGTEARAWVLEHHHYLQVASKLLHCYQAFLGTG
jgi:glycosyltransferase involved in cell wall biosynthesis